MHTEGSERVHGRLRLTKDERRYWQCGQIEVDDKGEWETRWCFYFFHLLISLVCDIFQCVGDLTVMKHGKRYWQCGRIKVDGKGEVGTRCLIFLLLSSYFFFSF